MRRSFGGSVTMIGRPCGGGGSNGRKGSKVPFQRPTAWHMLVSGTAGPPIARAVL